MENSIIEAFADRHPLSPPGWVGDILLQTLLGTRRYRKMIIPCKKFNLCNVDFMPQMKPNDKLMMVCTVLCVVVSVSERDIEMRVVPFRLECFERLPGLVRLVSEKAE